MGAMLEMRQQRGLEIAATAKIAKKGGDRRQSLGRLD